MAEGVDSKGRVLPRQMIRIQRTEPEENVVRTELRYVIYQSKRHLDDKALYEDNVVSEAVQCLMKKYAEMNSGYALPPHVPTIDATKFAKKLPEEEIQTSPTSPTSPKYISDKEWIAEAYRRLQMVAKRVQNIEKSATLIGPEFSHFQAQLTSLLTDLEERKRAGASPDAIYNDEYFCEKLEQLQQFAAKTACVREDYMREATVLLESRNKYTILNNFYHLNTNSYFRTKMNLYLYDFIGIFSNKKLKGLKIFKFLKTKH